MADSFDEMNRSCNICGCRRFVDMKPNRNTIFTRKNVQCEDCLSLERHRLIYEVLQQSGRLSKNQRVLHFAPETCLGDQFTRHFGPDYRACDIDPGLYHGLQVEQIDLCSDLEKLADREYDIVIHNHVLEHLSCDYKEVLRKIDNLLRVGGLHVFSLPFLLGGFKESLSGLTVDERIDRFGQHDHVRVFSPDDFAEVISSVFDPPMRYDATRLLSRERLQQIGIPEHQWHSFHNNSVFFLEKISATHTSCWLANPIEKERKRKKLFNGINQLKSALFITGDGPAKGHLVRSIAIAEQLGSTKPIFLTMSEDIDLLIEKGHQAHFVPHHNATGEDTVRWHKNLAREIESIVSSGNVKVLVYDLNFIFDGVIEILQRINIPSVWIRRAMWPRLHESYLGAGVHFSNIIEPAELAGSFDDGPTITNMTGVMRVPPILLTAPEQRLSRIEARNKLGVDENAMVFAVDLGGSRNKRFETVRSLVLEILAAQPDVEVFELRNDDVTKSISPSGSGTRSGRIPFHAYSYSAAWDAFIGRAGYNTFHEVIFGSLPTVFVPDTSPDMDRQDLRAKWANLNHCALMVDLDAAKADIRLVLGELLLHEKQQALSRACAECVSSSGTKPDGARIVAQFMERDLLGCQMVAE
ncbi:hypothetical protein IWQ54_001437 [Labrenzia sp. EL_195]|nr:hypothetical protein [Labrenzia sp. EL_195]